MIGLSILTREVLRLVMASHVGPFAFQGPLPGPAERLARMGQDIMQYHVDVAADAIDPYRNIDDMSEQVLAPMATALARCLKASGIRYFYSLPLPLKGHASRFICDGFTMRGIKIETGMHISSQGVWNGDILRFDVCGSKYRICDSLMAA